MSQAVHRSLSFISIYLIPISLSADLQPPATLTGSMKLAHYMVNVLLSTAVSLPFGRQWACFRTRLRSLDLQHSNGYILEANILCTIGMKYILDRLPAGYELFSKPRSSGLVGGPQSSSMPLAQTADSLSNSETSFSMDTRVAVILIPRIGSIHISAISWSIPILNLALVIYVLAARLQNANLTLANKALRNQLKHKPQVRKSSTIYKLSGFIIFTTFDADST